MSSLDSYAYSLARVRWDLFGSLSFRKVPSTAIAFGLAWQHMRHAAYVVEQPYAHLLIALRAEVGEKFGRFHFHYLLGGTNCRNTITLAHQLRSDWWIRTNSRAVVRSYDNTLAGVEYVTKCLSTFGKNEYELKKFDLTEQMTLSRSTFAVIASVERMGKDIRRARVKKTPCVEWGLVEPVPCCSALA